MPIPFRSPLLFVLMALTGLLAGVGGYTFYYARGASYLSNDPAACANCHVMREQFAGWNASVHTAVATCNDCHVPHDFVRKYAVKLENGIWHSKGFTFQDFHEPIQLRPVSKAILLENCVYCHGSLVSSLVTSHSGDAQIDCIACHRGVGH
jgi:cytochrome c nitrite reductase small subunit